MKTSNLSRANDCLTAGLSDQKRAWERSYANRDNFVFYPHEEVIRFVSRHIRKRIGLSEFRDIHSLEYVPRLLDLGCGIGRHVLYAHQMGLEAYGVDQSQTALEIASEWATQSGLPSGRLQQGDIRHLPWSTGFFDYIVSHGVLDSMHFRTAQAGIPEIARVLSPRGLFYCDLISTDDGQHQSGFNGEETVEDAFERGTIQSYFSLPKIRRLIAECFVIREAILVSRTNLQSSSSGARYHLVLEKLPK